MEKFAGWWRIGFIYFASGIGGTMLSAILIPYQPEVCAFNCTYLQITEHFSVLCAMFEYTQYMNYVS